MKSKKLFVVVFGLLSSYSVLFLWKDQFYSELCAIEERKINVMYINHQRRIRKKSWLLSGIIVSCFYITPINYWLFTMRQAQSALWTCKVSLSYTSSYNVDEKIISVFHMKMPTQ